MNVLLIGSGGREHALAWAIANSPSLTKLYAAPGNAGIELVAEICELNIDEHSNVVDFCGDHNIDLVVIGPEAPLAAGLADKLAMRKIPVFGPTRAAARLESSKSFTKNLCVKNGIPTAAYAEFDSSVFAKQHVARAPLPVVIKADGLAAGKGVFIATTLQEAQDAIDAIFAGDVGDDQSWIVIEDFLEGEEVSVFALCDGTNALYIGSAQDHKRAFDEDEGPNTGGMGAYSPAPVLSAALKDQIMKEIIQPTLRAMAERGTPFSGVLYAGLMITEEGPQLIEYNVRFGDPECQVLMMRLKDDILLLLKATADGVLDKMSARLKKETALTVVVASNGYPGPYEKGIPMPEVDQYGSEQTIVFHAGTKREERGLVATGGRVLNVTTLAEGVEEAREAVYSVIDEINWSGGFCRRDIGWRALDRSS